MQTRLRPVSSCALRAQCCYPCNRIRIHQRHLDSTFGGRNFSRHCSAGTAGAQPLEMTRCGCREHVLAVLHESSSVPGRQSFSRSAPLGHWVAPRKPWSLNLSLRHEVARLIVWHMVVTRPAVPSAVSYADV